MAIFGLDVGEKRVGVAKFDPETKIVTPVGVFLADKMDELVAKLATGDDDTLVVVGMPTNQRGELTAQSEMVKIWTMKLKSSLPENVKLVFFGESGTTKIAIERLRERGFDDVKIREARAAGVIDAEAACVILEGWAEENF
ncbi:MAG: Holliday junction resolvase RuvX [Candidatus Nomurabacteria bacterium]|jgi:putative Holliday junction resolvase|nr:Holliday junction resolvase RuvX [Candidatus Nomurabacteria bacterium]